MLKRQRSFVCLDSDVVSLIVPLLDDPRDLRATCRAFTFLFNASLPYQVELKPTTLRVLPAQEQLMVTDFRLVPNSMPHVTALTVDAPDFYFMTSALQSFPFLTSLNLSGQKLGKASFDSPGLRRLDLSFCDVAPGWRPSFSPSLEDLCVCSSNIGLEGLALPRLTHLNVKDCPTEQLPTAPLLYLNCSFNYLSARFLASIPLRLEYLDCSNGEVEDFEDDYDPARVFDFTHLTHLKYLSTCGVMQRAIPQSVEVVRISSFIPISMQVVLDESSCVVLVGDMVHDEYEEDEVSGWNRAWDAVPRGGARYLKLAASQ
jgi:hypothetical protein